MSVTDLNSAKESMSRGQETVFDNFWPIWSSDGLPMSTGQRSETPWSTWLIFVCVIDVSDLTSRSAFSVILVVIIVKNTQWVSISSDEVKMFALGQWWRWDVATESIENCEALHPWMSSTWMRDKSILDTIDISSMFCKHCLTESAMHVHASVQYWRSKRQSIEVSQNRHLSGLLTTQEKKRNEHFGIKMKKISETHKFEKEQMNPVCDIAEMFDEIKRLKIVYPLINQMQQIVWDGCYDRTTKICFVRWLFRDDVCGSGVSHVCINLWRWMKTYWRGETDLLKDDMSRRYRRSSNHVNGNTLSNRLVRVWWIFHISVRIRWRRIE